MLTNKRTNSFDKVMLASKLHPHLYRWRRQLVHAPECKRALAEESVRELYALYKKPLKAIFWCDNPYELVTIPPMVTILLKTSEWSELVDNQVSWGSPDSKEWKDRWHKEWRKLSKIITRSSKQINHSLATVESSIRERVRQKIKEIMLKILLSGKPRPGWISEALPAEEVLLAWGFKNNVADPSFFRGLMALQVKTARRARLDPRVALQTIFTANSRAFVPALVKELIPDFSELSNKTGLSESDYETASFIKGCFHDYERNAERLGNWFATIPFTVPSANSAAAWLPYTCAFLPFVLSCRLLKPDFFAGMDKEIDCWSYLSQAAGAYYFCKEFCFICPRPQSLLLDANERPHNASGPAAVWDDGYKVYSWKGRLLEADLIEKKHLISTRKIRSMQNVERRRLMIDIYGEEKFLLDAGASVVAEDEFGTLYKIALPRDETMAMVKVKNSTPETDGSFKHYFLRVPPHITSAKQAVAWTFGMEATEYQPQIET